MNHTSHTIHTGTRLAAFVLAMIATSAMLQSIDALASRDHGQTLATRTATSAVAAAAAWRQAARRG